MLVYIFRLNADLAKYCRARESGWIVVVGRALSSLIFLYIHALNFDWPYLQVHNLVGYCPQFDALLEDMTARETLKMFALLRGIANSECNKFAEYLSKELDFHKHLDKKVKQLSGGNKRKLSASVSLVGDPPILFLDEPTAGNFLQIITFLSLFYY